MSQINNLTGWGKSRPTKWQASADVNSYLFQLELWVKQVTDNLRGARSTPSYLVVDLPPAIDYDPSATGQAYFVFVSNETGGAQMAFSDGANWRRFTDRAIVS